MTKSVPAALSQTIYDLLPERFHNRLKQTEPGGWDVDLTNCFLTLDECQLLADALTNHHFITTLDLSWNNLTDIGAGLLAAALAKNTSLATLNLRNTGLTD